MKKPINIVNIYPAEINGVFISSPNDHLNNVIKNIIGNSDAIIEQNDDLMYWLKQMLHIETLPGIKKRQECDEENPDLYAHGIDSDFKKLNQTLPVGQVLFHGGTWFAKDLDELVLNRYTSTTLDPSWAVSCKRCKEIFILTVACPNIKFYAYAPNDNGNSEAEILLEKGIRLVKKEIYTLYSENNVPVDVVCVDAYKI